MKGPRKKKMTVMKKAMLGTPEVSNRFTNMVDIFLNLINQYGEVQK